MILIFGPFFGGMKKKPGKTGGFFGFFFFWMKKTPEKLGDINRLGKHCQPCAKLNLRFYKKTQYRLGIVPRTEGENQLSVVQP